MRQNSKDPSVVDKVSRSHGWKGRIFATAIGGTLLAFSAAVFITIYVPGYDGLDEAFMGGLALVTIWPLIMLWILFAESSGQAWRRAGAPTLIFLALDVAGLLL